jgi:hypothetical protein
MKSILFAFALVLCAPGFAAENALLAGYRGAASKENAAFKDFSATRGAAFYKNKAGDLSCSSCHGDSPTSIGKHASTGKVIKPLAPSANPERFTDAAKVEKWFGRNCNDVLERACTANEKGDFIAFVTSVQ